jgi:hypothetical protein
MIESSSFGVMTIDGRTYSSDLLIFPDGRVMDSWWRAEGHRFARTDLEGLIVTEPEIIVAGTGVYGLAKIEPELRDTLSGAGIELVAARTKKAVKAFNLALEQGRKVAGCFHLTC